MLKPIHASVGWWNNISFQLFRQFVYVLIYMGSLFSGAFAARADSDHIESACFAIPETKSTLILKRYPNHEVLAEYKLKLILNVNGKVKSEIDMFEDTGGYSRTNIYKKSNSVYLIRNLFGDTYEADLSRHTLMEKERMDDSSPKGDFIGCFDVDESETWRFISSSERKELPSKMH